MTVSKSAVGDKCTLPRPAIAGNTITLDVPLSVSFNSQYLDPQVVKNLGY
jgi:hypothetical protein